MFHNFGCGADAHGYDRSAAKHGLDQNKAKGFRILDWVQQSPSAAEEFDFPRAGNVSDVFDIFAVNVWA